MTNKEASFILANIDRRVCDDELNEALDMAIIALDQEPTKEEQALLQKWRDNRGISIEDFEDAMNALQEPCGDAIDRAEAIMIASGYCHPANIAKELAKLPPVTPQPKTGHWITKDNKEKGYDIGGVKTWYIQIMCSECGFIKTAIEGHTGQYHYCPNCGCSMFEPQERSDKE